MVLTVVFVLCLIATVIGECTYDSDRYVAYRGCANRDHNGDNCGNWLQANKWGTADFITKNEADANGIGDHNYCRNPGGKRHGVWCYRAGEKFYCAGVNDTTCVTQPAYDTKCPQATNTRSGTVETQPEIEQMNAMFAGTLNLQCKDGCSEDGVQWESRPGLHEGRERSNRLTIHPVTLATAGDWECTCEGKSYVKTVTVCTITWSVCQQVRGMWVKEGTNSCTGAKTPDDCTPSEEANSSEQDGEDLHDSPEQPNDYERRSTEDPRGKESGDAQAHNEGQGKEEESCTGSKCSFCQKHSLICGALGCLGGAITVVAAVFVKKSIQWRRKAKEYRPNNGSTMESQLTGSQAYSRQIADRNQLNYERALQIEDIVSQLGTERRQPGLSCSTSVTDTMHLQHLRQHDQLGRIQSKELQSNDNIACQRFEDSEALINHFAGALPEEDVMIYQEESAPLEAKRNTVGRPRFEDAAGHRDGTLFDKYYDQDVDKWSINEEVEI